MKKYLLTALLGVFGLFGFASADYSFVGTNHSYTPSIITLSNLDIDSSKVSYECPAGNCYIDIFNDFKECQISYYDGNLTFEDCDNLNGELSVSVAPSQNVFTSFKICPEGCSSSEGGESDSSPLLSGGTTVFSGIISSLGSAVSEFIPYVAYIGIGLLGAVIGFVAIKRLINRVRAKIYGTFNSRRRK